MEEYLPGFISDHIWQIIEIAPARAENIALAGHFKAGVIIEAKHASRMTYLDTRRAPSQAAVYRASNACKANDLTKPTDSRASQRVPDEQNVPRHQSKTDEQISACFSFSSPGMLQMYSAQR